MSPIQVSPFCIIIPELLKFGDYFTYKLFNNKSLFFSSLVEFISDKQSVAIAFLVRTLEDVV